MDIQFTILVLVSILCFFNFIIGIFTLKEIISIQNFLGDIKTKLYQLFLDEKSKNQFLNGGIIQNTQLLQEKSKKTLEQTIVPQFEELKNNLEIILKNVPSPQNLVESIENVNKFPVKLRYDENDKTCLVQSDNEEYFYLVREKDSWNLYVSKNILNKKPRHEHDQTLKEFFEIEKQLNSSRYIMVKSALINWDEKNLKGYLIEKGKIKQVL